MVVRRRRPPTVFKGGTGIPDAREDDTDLLQTVRNSAYVLVASGPRRGAEVSVNATPFTIGRGEDAHLQLDEDAASRRHASIERRGRGWVLRDLGSTNGTWCDGVLHGREATIKDGARFRIGETDLVFHSPEHAPDEET